MKKVVLRRDGFSGQHMLVLPGPVGAEARRHPLLRGLCVTDAGYFPNARHHFVDRPMGSTTTLVVLCLGGRGWIRSGATRSDIAAGDMAWLPENEPHAYGSDGEDPWTIVWAHFTGSEVPGWEELLAVEGSGRRKVLALPNDRLDELAFDRVYRALERGYAMRNLVASAVALRHTFSSAIHLGADRRKSLSARERVAISIEGLNGDWQRAHRLGELATAARVSVAHYSQLFRHQTGFSPIDFLIRIRVTHACHLLESTGLTIGEVGERTGYADPYYFTRCFRRVMGRAPRSYRKQVLLTRPSMKGADTGIRKGGCIW
jgi:AraC family transcriptional regulator of arabinose operon